MCASLHACLLFLLVCVASDCLHATTCLPVCVPACLTRSLSLYTACLSTLLNASQSIPVKDSSDDLISTPSFNPQNPVDSSGRCHRKSKLQRISLDRLFRLKQCNKLYWAYHDFDTLKRDQNKQIAELQRKPPPSYKCFAIMTNFRFT